MLITTTTLTRYSNGAELASLLSAGALSITCAAVVPSSRRRHILPIAEWGHLATDGLVIAWDAAAAQRLTDLAWLRTTIGATWPQLADPVPPARLLTAQPADQWSRIVAAWASLRIWRSVPALWDTVRILTNKV